VICGFPGCLWFVILLVDFVGFVCVCWVCGFRFSLFGLVALLFGVLLDVAIWR